MKHDAVRRLCHQGLKLKAQRSTPKKAVYSAPLGMIMRSNFPTSSQLHCAQHAIIINFATKDPTDFDAPLWDFTNRGHIQGDNSK